MASLQSHTLTISEFFSMSNLVVAHVNQKFPHTQRKCANTILRLILRMGRIEKFVKTISSLWPPVDDGV